MPNPKYQKIGLFVLTLSLMYFPLFLKLDYLPFRMWDESRPAIQAYEMIRSGNYWETTYGGVPDLWYTKPPLLVWFQVLFIHAVGYNELAIRLPVALTALSTCLLLGSFIYHNSRSFLWGAVTALVLCTMPGYVCVHGTRTGDVDVPLTFFLVLYAIAAFQYCIDSGSRWIYLFFLGLLGAVLCKSVAGLFFVPAVVLFVLLQKGMIKRLTSTRHFYISMLFFVIIVVSYYGIREYITPGYLRAVAGNEFFNRYSDVIEGHEQGLFYYVERITTQNPLVWISFLILGASVGLLSRERIIRKMTLLSILVVIQYIMLISFSETKPYWYDIPVYPFMALLIGYGVYCICTFLWIKSHFGIRRLTYILPTLFLVGVFYIPYQEMYLSVAKRGEPRFWDEQEYALSYRLRDVLRNDSENLDGGSLFLYEYEGHLLPYLYLLKEKGQTVHFTDEYEDCSGQIVLAYQDKANAYIRNTYHYEVLDSANYVVRYYISGKK